MQNLYETTEAICFIFRSVSREKEMRDNKGGGGEETEVRRYIDERWVFNISDPYRPKNLLQGQATDSYL